MRNFKFILVLSFEVSIMSCSSKKDIKQEDIVTSTVEIGTVSYDDVGPPPPEFKSSFETVKQWLHSISKEAPPKVPIEAYEFNLFESEDEYTLAFTGVNNYERDNYLSEVKIDFRPKNTYFTLPNREYNKLSREQVIERLHPLLSEFTKTSNFRRSFLAKASVIRTAYNGETIWSK